MWAMGVRLTYQGQDVGSASITIAEPDQVSFRRQESVPGL